MGAPPAIAIEDLAEIAGPNAYRGSRWHLSPAIERATAAHKRAVVEAKPKQRKSTRRVSGHDRKRPPLALVEENPPLPSNAIVVDYASLHALLRARADQLGISRETLDHVTGLQSGMSSKVLSLSKIKRLGMMSLGPMLDALCLTLVAVPDDEAFARNKNRYVKRDKAHHTSASKGHAANPRPLKKISGTVTGRLFGWPVAET